MIAIIDYGVGNLFSLKASCSYIGADTVVTRDSQEIAQASRIILPGVGAFKDAMQKLKASGMDEVMISEAKRGKPILGICLGMQLLYERSYEFGECEGLGLIRGEIASIKEDLDRPLKVPHIGWNRLSLTKPKDSLFREVKDGDGVYFVHSFYGKNCDDSVIAKTEYGIDITAAVRNENVYGTQFHPEKSGAVGLSILRAFNEV